MAVQDNSNEYIRVLGAQQNNLKGIDVDIPINHLTVVTGVSGSGKSSLVFDTLYAEGQRRYVESLSAYARQFLERMDKPRVREISGISPAIAIRQKNVTRNPRSTVGTVTEIYDYLRLLYSRIGTIICRECGREVKKDTIDEVVEQLARLPEGTRIYLTFPFKGSGLDLNLPDGQRAANLSECLENLIKQGFHRLLIDSKIRQLPEAPPQSLKELESSRVLVDRLVIREDIRDRLTDSLEMCYGEGNGIAEVQILEMPEPADSASAQQSGVSQHFAKASAGPPEPCAKAGRSAGQPVSILRFTERFECQYCSIPYRAPEPRLFSFNNPYGACPTCQGFGNTISLDPDLIVPDPGRTIAQGPVDPFNKPRYRRFQRKLESWALQKGIPRDVSYAELPERTRRKIWRGDAGFPGVEGFFRYLERRKYKMHVRIFIARYRGYTRCPDCEGERLCEEARDVYLNGKRITQLTSLPISEIKDFFTQLKLTPSQQAIAARLYREVQQRLEFLVKVGLEYLTLDRLASTLSGGEMQRIQLAASLSSSLVGTLYVLDEPSVGLHPRDEKRLIEILKELRNLGNTIVVVEHEREMIESADHVIDLGPGAGEWGGQLIHTGDVNSLLENDRSLTGKYLRGTLRIPTPTFRRPSNGKHLTLHGVREHNLKDLTVKIPLGILVCITGVSGSGKSTLVQDVLYAGLKKLKGDWKEAAGRFDSMEGTERVSEVLLVDQSPIGKTPRSNPVTYIKAFDDIRQTFASLREARAHGLTPGHFSFNVSGGRCETCQGSGTIVVEMQFLADVELVCEDCKGTRFKSKTLEVTYKGKNIAEVLNMTVQEGLDFFKGHSALIRKLRVLQEVGLGYLRLGQSATTLSGGEAQRIKLASYLSRPTSARPLFIFDEPTTGLHFDDIQKLLRAFDRLIARGASVLVIEHNLDIIKCADWVIDLGPEGGDAGGYLVAEGPPEAIAGVERSYTGQFLKKVLAV